MKQARTVQDGHTLAEHAIHVALWKAGTPQPDGTRIRVATDPQVASETGVTSKTVARCRKALAEKHSLEVIGFDSRKGSRYRIYPFSEILRRRREAGLVKLHRRGRFAHPDEVVNLPFETRTTVTSARLGEDDFLRPARPKDRGPNNALTNDLLEFVSLLTELAAQVMPHLGPPNDRTATNIRDAARQKSPDATPAEIAWFIRNKIVGGANFKTWGGVVAALREDW